MSSQRFQHFALIITVASLTAGCSTMPAFGPDAEAINQASFQGENQAADILPFKLVNVTAATLPANEQSTAFFPMTFRYQKFLSADETISIGDQLNIRIWEVADDGLFATEGNRETALNVEVSNSGQITVPYAGTLNTDGLTIAQLRSLLLERYQGRAVEPEIAVSITSTDGRSATLLGNVRSPGRLTIPARGIRLLDLIAQSGGASSPTWETSVTIQRGPVSGTLTLAKIARSQANNVVILPGDTVTLGHAPRRFAVYGGVSRPSNIEIPIETASLAYLLAEVGGLNDRVAQARSVYVFRPDAGARNATAYQLDFSRPDALLLAGAFRLEPTDITYVASSGAADFQRFMSLVLSPLFGTMSGVKRIVD
ncbi:SLBB domain-containing protein [Lentibacter algarum]|uniref:SLBB domain-containing protein n=1 Tax=Lentibacter algarum TaxID=576131 RepID=UPI002302E71D|nr:SLBB domain-containing protein [Lentibacter algarum]